MHHAIIVCSPLIIHIYIYIYIYICVINEMRNMLIQVEFDIIDKLNVTISYNSKRHDQDNK